MPWLSQTYANHNFVLAQLAQCNGTAKLKKTQKTKQIGVVGRETTIGMVYA
jgi:hypothetical protein